MSTPQPPPLPHLVAILPSNNLTASAAFYARLNFHPASSSSSSSSYLILADPTGRALHLTDAVEGWLVPGKNPFGLYLQARSAEEVEELARAFEGEILGGDGIEVKEWGMYEFALSDPEGTLVRVGWPARLMGESGKVEGAEEEKAEGTEEKKVD